MDPETRPTEDGDQQNQSTRLKDLELRLKKMELIFKQTRDSKRDDCELKPMLERLNLILSSRTKALFHDVFTLTVTLAVIGWIIFMIAYGSANMEEWTQNTKTTIDTRERDQITAPNIAICALSALEFLEGGHIGQILVEASIYDDLRYKNFGLSYVRSPDNETVDVGLFGNSSTYRCQIIKPQYEFTKSKGKQPLVYIGIALDQSLGIPGAYISLYHPADGITSGVISLVGTGLNSVPFTLVETQNNDDPPKRSYQYTVTALQVNLRLLKGCEVLVFPATYVTSVIQTKQSNYYLFSNLGGFLSVFEFGFALLTLALYWFFFLSDKYLVKRARSPPSSLSLQQDIPPSKYSANVEQGKNAKLDSLKEVTTVHL
mmetsp:Transcript_44296/g.72084  ORF Transcript_44296/g.72084 Transcript_44296/m.72084 type:complete len:374 (+) Transcript_44296:243-1364(+)|eukprot:CAMPEP_0184643302 /NCGR_PEP_ID=MMETSP0308-20130426/118_1 /TAXON_ID=38269 /ORGANISM="Gloeochaete witrockiana, Strain SAG 46.84" /LENGTH=373 /DNA_ID=CAMNT_0027071127 /DNA_START=196 /DNA_END=1317 /DNA_ORIENTATION=-